MATPRADTYSAASGQAVRGGRNAIPSWISAQPVGQWFNAPNSTVAGLATDAGTVQPYIMNSYSGTVMAGNRLFAFGGGHGDGTDNTVAVYDLDAGAGWSVFCQPTPVAQRNSAVNGDTDLSKFWWGDPGNLKPNPCHTYSYGQYVPEQNRLIWLCHRGVYSFSGYIGANDRMLQLKLDTASWVQPGSAEDILVAGDAFASVRLPSGIILHSSSGSYIKAFDPSQPIGSQITNWVYDGSLNWNGYGQYLLDSAHNRIVRVGNAYGTALYKLIDLTTKAVTDLGALLNGDAGVLSGLNSLCIVDTMGACIDPINNRVVIPLQAAGGQFYAIDLDTYTVTLQSPSLVAGATVAKQPGSGGSFGRVHYHDTYKCIVYSPDASAPMALMRLA